MLLAIIIAAAATSGATAASPANDICLAMIPPSLAALLSSQNTEFALPMLTDVPVERLMRTAALGGWPCPYVAIADFDGDGNLDRALLLKHKTEPTVRLIVAHNEAGKWRIELQKDWPIAIADAQVEPLEAGLYEQAKGGRDAVQEIDNLKSIQSDRAGFLGGPAIGTKQAFFSINGEWQSIRLED